MKPFPVTLSLFAAALSVVLPQHVSAQDQAGAVTPAKAGDSGAAFQYTEVARKTVQFSDHTLTLVRVRPPALPKAPPATLPVPLTAEQQATAERMEQKVHATLNITATVYLDGDKPVTELKWRSEESGNLEYRAYSNADFRYLTQLPYLESETTVYSWFPFVSAYSLADWTQDQEYPLPTGLALSATEVEYLVDSRAKDVAGQETTLAGLDYLHAYYQLHYDELKAAHNKREAENAAREEELRKNPPKTPDATLRWWPLSATSTR